MSRIEDALNKARYVRSISGISGSIPKSPGPCAPDNGINVLVISRDLSISCLVRNLQSLTQADVIVSSNIAHGRRALLEQKPETINDSELSFTALMLDTLCCCYGREPENVVAG